MLVRVQIQQQRVKHLQYEQQGAVAALKAGALEASHRQQAAAAAQVAAEIALQAELQQRNKAQVCPKSKRSKTQKENSGQTLSL